MRLHKVGLRNFRGYRDETFMEFDDLTTLIGRNDAGKSTIIEALEIFFNGKSVVCERDDLSVNSNENSIEISCFFTDLPAQLILDATVHTTLQDEYLLNGEGYLEIRKVFSATSAKPKAKTFIICEHPSEEGICDLHSLKIAELKERARSRGVPEENYDARVCSSIRRAIWNHAAGFATHTTKVPTEKEEGKRLYEAISNSLPIFALFQSDRKSTDDDKEVADPMKVAVDLALKTVVREIEHIKAQVQAEVLETARRTLDKLMEMDSDLANELIPDFKTEPKLNSLFKLTLRTDENISINKRGSGVRRLVLLNFFRAEAERRQQETSTNQVIYAFEEPETSQHPDHQELLVKAFVEMSCTPGCQIILTTHTPALAGIMPLESLRYIEKTTNGPIIEPASDAVFEKIALALGVLPNPIAKEANALLLVEGTGDVTFVQHTARSLKDAGYLNESFEDKRIAIIPIGGCGNLKYWRTKKLAEQFQIPFCVLLDSDLGTAEADKNATQVQGLNAEGIKAYLTRKREPENYIDPNVLDLDDGGAFSIGDEEDAKSKIARAKLTRPAQVIEKYWTLMTADQIRIAERYDDNGVDRQEFTEMFTDFLSIV